MRKYIGVNNYYSCAVWCQVHNVEPEAMFRSGEITLRECQLVYDQLVILYQKNTSPAGNEAIYAGSIQLKLDL